MTAGYFCLTCRRHAPNVGYYGLLGAPDIRPLAEVRGVKFCEGGTPTFGYLVEPLAGMGIRKPDLERFTEWLRQHAGHEITVDLNGENEQLRALTAADPQIDDEAQSMWRQERETLEGGLASGGLAVGQYAAACRQCDDIIEADEPDVMTPYSPFQPDTAVREMFLARWAEPDSMFAHGMSGSLEMYTFLPDFIGFLTKHRGHPIEVRFTPRPAK
jgi:hypothetical protein